jgi:outer membrane murein-binding lipoprotein Lpp
MAGTTPKGFHYPTAGDNPQVATDIQTLATDVDTELNDYLTNATAASTYATITDAATEDKVRSIAFMLGGM